MASVTVVVVVVEVMIVVVVAGAFEVTEFVDEVTLRQEQALEMRDGEYDDAHTGAAAGGMTAMRLSLGWAPATRLESSSFEGGGMLRFLGRNVTTGVAAGVSVTVSVMVDGTAVFRAE